MQFNLINDQEQVAQFVWRGVSIRVHEHFGGVPAAFLACVCIISMWRFFRGVFRQF